MSDINSLVLNAVCGECSKLYYPKSKKFSTVCSKGSHEPIIARTACTWCERIEHCFFVKADVI